ncbi:MAG: sulfite oxidase heme-binding subunit YedZ [Rhodoblastus sp.]
MELVRTHNSLALWRDRTGAFSLARTLALAIVLAPALPLFWRAGTGDFGPRPLTEISHATGLWALRLLAVTMAITPLIEILRLPRLASARRYLGVGVFGWLAAHLLAFIADKSFSLAVVAQEIFVRVYLLIGAGALLVFAALAATSCDGAIRRLGAKNWKRLHRLVYAATLAGLVHFFMQSKLDVSEPTAMAGVFAFLGFLRLPRRFGRTLTPPIVLAAGALTTALVALAEAAWYALAMGASFGALIAADFSLEAGLRPCWAAMAAGIAMALAGGLVRALAAARAVKRAGVSNDATRSACTYIR